MKIYVYIASWYEDHETYGTSNVLVSDKLDFVQDFEFNNVEEWENGQKQREWTLSLYDGSWTEFI